MDSFLALIPLVIQGRENVLWNTLRKWTELSTYNCNTFPFSSMCLESLLPSVPPSEISWLLFEAKQEFLETYLIDLGLRIGTHLWDACSMHLNGMVALVQGKL